MSDFNALLTRAFAEAEEPVDDGFAAGLASRIARREKAAAFGRVAHGVALSVGVAAGAYGLWLMFGGAGMQFANSASEELARTQEWIARPPSTAVSNVIQSLGVGMVQVSVAVAALVGGAVAFRNAQD